MALLLHRGATRRMLVVLLLLLASFAVSEAHQTAQARCGAVVVANVFGYTTSSAGCGIAGHPGYKVEYTWSVQAGTGQVACVQAKGYNSAQQATWLSLGCGGGSGAAVPWGNVLATPQIKAKAFANSLLANVTWSAI